MENIKTAFIRNILREEGRRMLSSQGRAIRKELQFHTHRLVRDRTVEVLPWHARGEALKLTVPHYNRLLDISVRKVRRKKPGKGRRARSLRIYNRFVMGAYYAVARRLASDFTEEARRSIKLRFTGGAR